MHLLAGSTHGGAETAAIDAILALHEKGVAQMVLCRPHDNYLTPLRDAGIPFETLAFARWKKWLERRAIRQAIDRYNPDIIHCWRGWPASFLPNDINVPALGWFAGCAKMKYYAACDFYMGITHEIVAYIKAQTEKPERVFLTHTFGTLPSDAPLTRADFNIPEDKPIVLLLARMHFEKGVDVLLHAAREVDGYFLLAGEGPERDAYHKLAERLGVMERVRFLGWRRDRAALLDLADVCVLPSRHETFGTVMAEAWGKGVALIASKTPGPKQYITHGENGLLFEIGDAAGLASALQALLQDNDLRERLVAGGRRTYASGFSKEAVVSSLLQAYEEILRRSQSVKR